MAYLPISNCLRFLAHVDQYVRSMSKFSDICINVDIHFHCTNPIIISFFSFWCKIIMAENNYCCVCEFFFEKLFIFFFGIWLTDKEWLAALEVAYCQYGWLAAVEVASYHVYWLIDGMDG